MILACLLACVPRGSEDEDPIPLPACPSPINEGWLPETELEARVDESTAVWEASSVASVDATRVEGCFTAPCVAIGGPGYGEVGVSLNRGVEHTLSARVSAPLGTEIQLVQYEFDGAAVVLERWVVEPAIDTAVTVPVTLLSAGSTNAFRFTAENGDVVLVDDLSVSGPRWSDVPDVGAGTLMLGFLLHIEENGAFGSDEIAWRNKARVVEAMAELFSRHEARLTVQPDVTFIKAATNWDPDWVAAREAEGVSWSAHIHDETNGEEGVSSAVRAARQGFETAGVTVTDVNGGFGIAPWKEVASAGYRSLSAYKSGETQLGLPLAYTSPWRVADGAGTSNEDQFQVHDPEGPLIYVPGMSARESDTSRYVSYASGALSQALAHSRGDFVNTWYFVEHVDSFGPADEQAAMTEWLDAGGMTEALLPYDTFFSDVSGPIRDAGRIEYSTPWSMAFSFEAWSSRCSG